MKFEIAGDVGALFALDFEMVLIAGTARGKT
jgi:hypothetical protein